MFGIDPNESKSIELEGVTFNIRCLTVRQFAKLQKSLEELSKGLEEYSMIEYLDKLEEVLKVFVSGWSNLKTATGADIEYNSEFLITDILHPSHCSAILTKAVSMNSFTQDEEKN